MGLDFDYTLEECLGDQICVRIFQEDDHVDTVLEIWQISKPADYEELKKQIKQLIETDMLKAYYIC